MIQRRAFVAGIKTRITVWRITFAWSWAPL
jgi:hypothetical protein